VKQLRGRHGDVTQASPEQLMELAADLEGYPRWFGSVVRRVVPLGGGRADVTLAAHIGPLRREFAFAMVLERDGDGHVRLSRLPLDDADPETFVVTW